jgi:hypothetical protein
MSIRDRENPSKGSRRDGRGGRGKSFQSDSEFVNRELTEAETRAQRAWRDDFEAVSAVWDELLEAGYRVNTKYDDYNDCYSAYIIPGTGGDNDGLLLSGRGGSAYRAIAEALFKHSEIFRGTWSVNGNHTRREADPEF